MDNLFIKDSQMKIFIVISFLGLSFASLSSENDPNENCLKNKTIILDTKIFEKLHQHLSWSAASSLDISKSACKSRKVPTPDEIKDYLKQQDAGPVDDTKSSSKNQSVNGVNFENESAKMIEAFENLTTSYDTFGMYKRPENQKDFQQKYNINPECKKVICAVEKIWGEELGLKMLYILTKHHFNTSEFAYSNSDRFKIKEIDDVILGLEDLPQSFMPLGESSQRPFQRLAHYKRGAVSPFDDAKTYANAVVMLFDEWSKQNSADRQYTVFHEMSHNISSSLGGVDESPDWLALSSWTKVGDEWEKDKNACMPSKYGSANPDEDWAESLAAYRYNSINFKTRCPEKYKFIKEVVFDDVEYTHEELCQD